MHNGRRANMLKRQPKPQGARAGHSQPWVSSAPRPQPRGHNTRRSYERYLALAQAEVQAGDRVAAENYYQHAEHYFRSMTSNQPL